jgi:UDP-2,3-diacylglucosamine hydrolase
MPSKPVYIASDAHLGGVPPRREEAFLAWLAHAGEAASQIVLNGDLFDFWFEYVWGIPRGHQRVLGLLREIVGGGTPVTLMGGNHDWWGGRYLREEIGLEFLTDPVTRDYAGFRTFLAHGDGLGKGDLGYRVLRLLLRGRLTRFAFSLLPPAVGGVIGGGVSKTEDRWGESTEDDKNRSAALQAWALAKLRDEPDLDLVVLGHTHIPRLVEVDPGRWYVNAGDWVRSATYLVLATGEAPSLKVWEG